MSRPKARRSVPVLDSVRLGRFKSFSESVLSLSELTLLIGKNGSGKSNAIDGLTALARLAEGDDVRDALDGSRADAEPIRGGAEGCAPHGEDSFELGCTVSAGAARYALHVIVQVRPEVRIRSERLRVVDGVTYGNRSLADRDLLVTDDADDRRSDLDARWFNGKRGVDPRLPFASNRLLLTQVPARLPADTEAARIVDEGASAVRAALRSVFILDPVPHLMRQYVNARDNGLRRNAENLSAPVAAVAERSDADFDELQNLLRAMPDRPFQNISMARSDLGDVLVTMTETDPRTGRLVCDRDPATGRSRLTRLVDLPGYATTMARGSLGEVVGRGLLADAAVERPAMSAEFAELLGGV